MKEWYRRLALILTVVLLAGSLVSCGSKDTGGPEKTASSEKDSKKDKNSDFDIAGTYMIYRFGEGETQLDGDLLKASGMDKSYLKLDSDHTGVFVLSDTETPIEWNEDGEISTQGVVLYHFTIEGDVVNLDMMGNPIIFLRKGADTPDTLVAGDKKETEAGEYISVQSAKGFDLYYAYQMAIGDDTFYDCLQMGMSPENTKLQVNNEGSVYVTMGGYETKFIFANGKVSTDGMDLYTYEVVSNDEIDLNMQGTTYRFVREDSDLAKSVGLTGDAVAGSGGVYIPNPGELEAEFEGGQLFYTERNGEAIINYISLYDKAKDLYIPEEVNGLLVVGVEKIGGNIENLYYPYGIYEIDRPIGPVVGVKTIFFGYGDHDCRLSYIFQGLEHGENLTKIVFHESIKDIGWSAKTFHDPEAFPNLCEVVNPPLKWRQGIENHEKLLALLAEQDPNNFIIQPSEKVTSLAKEITADCKTDEEKLYAISEWICENIQYDISYNYHNYLKEYLPDIVTDDILESHTCVCSGYSHLTKEMCNAVGIPAVYIVGDMAGIKHAWNAVYINGKWGLYDNTENDTDYNVDISLFRDMDEYYEAIESSKITYEQYLANKELQEAYTWEELESIQNAEKESQTFAEHHPYYNINTVLMSANRIPEKYEGIKFLDGNVIE